MLFEFFAIFCVHMRIGYKNVNGCLHKGDYTQNNPIFNGYIMIPTFSRNSLNKKTRGSHTYPSDLQITILGILGLVYHQVI